MFSCHPDVEVEGSAGPAAHSVIPIEVERSRAVCGAQAQASRPARRPRSCRDLRMRPEDGARFLDYPFGFAQGFGSPG